MDGRHDKISSNTYACDVKRIRPSFVKEIPFWFVLPPDIEELLMSSTMIDVGVLLLACA
jgi:hypothetical protein